jgi:exosome complex RNA-binding protein Rrp42 (RNase PH superfamily)
MLTDYLKINMPVFDKIYGVGSIVEINSDGLFQVKFKNQPLNIMFLDSGHNCLIEKPSEENMAVFDTDIFIIMNKDLKKNSISKKAEKIYDKYNFKSYSNLSQKINEMSDEEFENYKNKIIKPDIIEKNDEDTNRTFGD